MSIIAQKCIDGVRGLSGQEPEFFFPLTARDVRVVIEAFERDEETDARQATETFALNAYDALGMLEFQDGETLAGVVGYLDTLWALVLLAETLGDYDGRPISAPTLATDFADLVLNDESAGRALDVARVHAQALKDSTHWVEPGRLLADALTEYYRDA